MDTSEKFCLRWNDFETNISTAFRELREDKDFFDVTLACDDDQMQAHKVILSACSPFFKTILKRNRHEHPLLYLKGVRYTDLVSVLNFMYHGEVNVAQEDLNTFLSVAEELKIKGLTQQDKTSNNEKSDTYFQQGGRKENLSKNNPVIAPKKIKTSPKEVHNTSAHYKYSTDDDIEEILPVKTEPGLSSQSFTSPAGIVQSGTNVQHDGAANQNTALVESRDNNAMYGEEYGEFEDYHGGDGYDHASMQDNIGGNTDLNTMLDSMISKCEEGSSSGPAKFMCGSCGKIMGRRKDLRRHVEIHLDMTHPCGICPKVMKTRSSLACHYSQQHKNEVASPWSMI